MRLGFVFIAVFLAGCAAHHHPVLPVGAPYTDLGALKKEDIVHLGTGRKLTREELFDYLAAHRVVYVGEAHDSVDDHRVQLEILRGLAERHPGQLGVGMEMLRRPYQSDADRWVAGELTEKELARQWSESWGNSYPYYRELLLFCRDNGIPIVALNASREAMGAVRGMPAGHGEGEGDSAKTAEAHSEADVPEMDFDDPYYRDFVGAMYAGHGAHGSHGGMGDVFLRIQTLWDETMAESAARWMEAPENEGKRLVVFAGGNHVRYGFGIPRRLFRRVPAAHVVVEPWAVEVPVRKQSEMMDVEVPQLPMRSADIVWGVGYEDLAEVRVALGVRLEAGDDGGVSVLDVAPGSPAEAAGVRAGDRILAIDGVEVNEPFDLSWEVDQHRPGDESELRVQRGDEELTLSVTHAVLKPHHHPKS